MIVQRFNLNLIPNQSPVVVHVNQYDTGTGRLIATLYEGNEPYSPNGTAVIQGTKPDGHGFQYTVRLDGNVVTADLTEQMSPVAGDVRAQIVVTESSGVTGTFVFIMRVQPSALPSDTDMSESDYPLIEEAIREAQEAVETAQEAVETAQEATETAQEAAQRAQEAIAETSENAENSEAWAQGTRGGIPVEPTDPTYEHNAEYWAQYAERYAQGGLHYKASIPFADIPTTGMREGDMYDITDDFTTDSRFTEGAGIKVKGGTNIAWNSDNKWDILALPYIPKTTFNGRSGSILPIAGDYSADQVNYDSNKTVKQVIDALATKEASDIAGQQSLLKDTVGWTGKNLIPLPYEFGNQQTQGGITAKTNADGSITFNGTVTASISFRLKGRSIHDDNYFLVKPGKYIFSCGNIENNFYWGIATTKNNSYSAIADGLHTSTYELTITSDMSDEAVDGAIPLAIYANFRTLGDVYNNFTVYPMLRKADITDPTYEPYHESVEEEIEQVYAGNGVLGAKNLLNPFISMSFPTTINGITYTSDSKGIITANGTESGNAEISLTSRVDFAKSLKLPIGRYIYSGRPNVDNGNVDIYVANTVNNTYHKIAGTTSGTEFEFEITQSMLESGKDYCAVGVYINIRNSQTVSNMIFKPMIRLASDPDDTYQPYAMTNRELTEELTVKQSEISTSLSTTLNVLRKYGKIVTFSFRSTNTTGSADDEIGIIPVGFRPANNCTILAGITDGASKRITIAPNSGKVAFADPVTDTTLTIHTTWITS